MDFVHLHAHTHYSMQSSPVFPGEMFSTALKYGMNTIAVTDYCAIFNMPELFNEARTAGIKLIIGSQLLLLETDPHQHGSAPVSPSLVLLVQNEAGYRNLCILLSRAAKDGFVHGMPHIESRLLETFHEGLVCLSAYSSGRIGRALLAGAIDEAESFATCYRDIFGDNFYLELQRHNTPFDNTLNELTIALSRKLSIELVATNNVHYLHRKDAGCYRAMVANRTKEKLSSQNLLALPGSDHYLKSSEEMSALFTDEHRELRNSVAIAQKCTYTFSNK